MSGPLEPQRVDFWFILQASRWTISRVPDTAHENNRYEQDVWDSPALLSLAIFPFLHPHLITDASEIAALDHWEVHSADGQDSSSNNIGMDYETRQQGNR